MRVIAGEYKGRKLQTPSDYAIRPTSDKVKEALFSILTDISDRSFYFLDLNWKLRLVTQGIIDAYHRKSPSQQI